MKQKYNTYVGGTGLGAYAIAVRDAKTNDPLPKEQLDKIAAKLQAVLNNEHEGEWTSVYANGAR